jgi:dephospho-CoA kinase
MGKSLKIGLTGGIASGKTTISDYFKALGIPIIDADVISHEVTKPNGSAFEEIISSFGSNILDKSGLIDRKKMRAIIFDDVSKKEILEGIIHPKVREEIFNLVSQSNDHYLILSVPLLIETGMNQMMDRVLVVDCSVNTQIERLIQRDKINLDEAKSILRNQTNRSIRLKVADDLIVNEKNVTLIDLEKEVFELHRIYSKL